MQATCDRPTVIRAGGGVFYAPDAAQVNIVWKNVPRFTAGPPANMEIVLAISGEIDQIGRASCRERV